LDKKKEQPIIEIDIEGWKGKDYLEIYRGFGNDVMIYEHRKDKETGEIIKIPHLIPYENINHILSIIKKVKVGEKLSYKDVVLILMKRFDLRFGLDAFNGGQNRSRYYFPMYYFPIKFLERIELIKYSGGGTITRLK